MNRLGSWKCWQKVLKHENTYTYTHHLLMGIFPTWMLRISTTTRKWMQKLTQCYHKHLMDALPFPGRLTLSAKDNSFLSTNREHGSRNKKERKNGPVTKWYCSLVCVCVSITDGWSEWRQTAKKWCTLNRQQQQQMQCACKSMSHTTLLSHSYMCFRQEAASGRQKKNKQKQVRMHAHHAWLHWTTWLHCTCQYEGATLPCVWTSKHVQTCQRVVRITNSWDSDRRKKELVCSS